MNYTHRDDFKRLLSDTLELDRNGTVRCSVSPLGGYVVNVKTQRSHVRVWTADMDDAFEAARCALQECTC